MPFTSPVLRCYEELELIVEQMLEASQAGNWDAMNELQVVYSAQVDLLRGIPDEAPLSSGERMMRHERLTRILAYDAAIRKIMVPEWTRLSEILGTARRRNSLNAAYGAHA